MAGLKSQRDLGLDMMLSSAVDVTPVNGSPLVHTPEEVVEVAAPAPAPVPPVATRIKPNKAKLTPSWKQTGLSLTADTMMRLRLESLKSGKTMSEITETILGKHLPHYKIAV